MEKNLICHGDCKQYYPRGQLTYVTKNKRLCDICFKAYEEKKAEKERKKLKKQIEDEVRKENAEKARIKREKKKEEERLRKEEDEKKTAEEQRLNEEYKKHLFYLVARTFGIKYPNPMMLAQIRNFHYKRKLGYHGMILAWQLIVETKGAFNLDINYGVALIPFYYEKAIEQFQEQQMRVYAAKKHTAPVVKQVVVAKKQLTAREKLLQRNTIAMEEL